MEKLYSTSAVSVGGRDGHVKSADGIIDLDLKMPAAMGGKGGATTPEDLFASGYSACYNSALNMIARMKRIKTGEVSVKVSVSLVKFDDQTLNLEAEIEARVPGVSQQVAQELADGAHEVCPYSRAIRGNVKTIITAIAE